jgi:hypothetical protein
VLVTPVLVLVLHGVLVAPVILVLHGVLHVAEANSCLVAERRERVLVSSNGISSNASSSVPRTA